MIRVGFGTVIVLVACTGQVGETGTSSERSQLARMSAQDYLGAVRALFPSTDAGATAPFAHEESSLRYTTWARGSEIDPIDVDEVWRAAELLATRWVAQERVRTSSCLSRTPTDDACIRSSFAEGLSKLWPIPPDEAELDAVVAEVAAARGELDAAGALVMAMRSAMMSPRFLFRSEIGVGGRLTSREVAAALGFILTNSPGDALLTEAATNDALRSAEDIRPHVQRLVETPDLPLLRGFLAEYLKWGATLNVRKDALKFPWHDATALENDTSRVVAQLTTEHARRGLLRALLTSDLAFVRPATKASWAITADLPPEGRFVHDAQRVGIFTHPSWLSGMSENDHNHLVRRGRFIQDRLLCGVVPSLPIGVVPGIEQKDGTSFRARVEQHSKDASCWGCHRKMDPLGFAFEGYDHTGRPQQVDNGAPVVTSGTLEGAGEQDGEYADVRELMFRLADSRVVQRCFVRNLLSYVRGRELHASDEPEVHRLAWVYSQSEDTLAVIEAALAHDTFLSRVEP